MPSLHASRSPAVVDDGDESDLTPLTDTDFSDSDDSDFEATAPPAKKRRVTQPKATPVKSMKKKEVVKAAPKKLRAFKGVLKGMWALPLDVTFEIFGHLKPLDLLQLSRTSKKLRELLLNRSCQSVWMRARANVEGLPDCPFDMSEPAYANLMFEAYCHYCHANNVQTVIWEARVRCCKRCGGQRFAHWVNLVKEEVPDVLQCIVPGTHEFTTGTIYPHTEKKYSFQRALDLTVEMSRLSEDEQALWFWNKKKEFDRIVEHSVLCRDFMSGRHSRRHNEREEIRLRRTNAIIAKLSGLGWSDEITKMPMRRLSEHKHVKIPKDLTERAWQKIEADMIAFMEDIRAKRLVKERNRVMSHRCSLVKQVHASFVASQPLHAILPGVADYAMMPELRAVLENPDLSVDATIEDFQLGNDRMLEFAEQWREEKDEALLEILRQSSVGATASKDLLSRATTLFNCKNCNLPISYPRILVHTCNFARNMDISDPTDNFARLRAEPWNLGGDRVSFHEAAHKRAKHVLKALSLPPETTVDQMMELNPFVECYCANCYHPGKDRNFARWNRMIEHTPRYTASHVPKPFGAVDGRKIGLIKKMETSDLVKLRRQHEWGQYSRNYCCITCKARDTRHSIEKHIIAEHSVSIPQFGTDLTYHLDAKLELRAPFVMLKIAPRPKNAEAVTSTAASTPAPTTPTTSTGTTPAPSAPASTPPGIPIQGASSSGSISVPLTPSSSLAMVVAQLTVTNGSDSDTPMDSIPDAPQVASSSSTGTSVSSPDQ